MNKRLGVVMDPIATITIKKDTTFAILLAAQARGWSIRYFEQSDLYLRDGRACGRARALTVRDDRQDWYSLGEPQDEPLAGLDVLLMRKDPPFDLEYIYTTYLLERAEAEGVRVVNRPQSLRDANEKLFTAWFPQCCPPTLATRDMARLRGFVAEHGDAILKPLDGMGGAGIFRVRAGDANLNVIVETLTERGRRTALAQRFIPEISAGDKRILMIDGEPVPYALARIPAEGETRGNLAAGGRGVAMALTAREREIAGFLAPTLWARGLLIVGLDVIGGHLTEINVTSPTCMVEIAAQQGFDVAGLVIDKLERACG